MQFVSAHCAARNMAFALLLAAVAKVPALTGGQLDVVTKFDVSALLLFEEQCSACTASLAAIEHATAVVEAEGIEIAFAKVDIKAEKISGVPRHSPTIKFFRQGRMYDFDGEHESRELAEALRKQVLLVEREAAGANPLEGARQRLQQQLDAASLTARHLASLINVDLGGLTTLRATPLQPKKPVYRMPLAALKKSGTRTPGLSDMIESPLYQQYLSSKGLVLPPAFTFTVFALSQLFATGKAAEPLWQAWWTYHLAMKTSQHALIFWTLAELEWLQDKRLSARAHLARKQQNKQFEQLLKPLMEMFPTVLPPERITEGHFARALAVVESQLIWFDNEWVLLPVPMRQAPAGCAAATVNASLLNDKDEAFVELQLREGTKAGTEFVLDAGEASRYNGQLLLTSGYVWDDVSAASLNLRLQLAEEPAQLEMRRKILREGFGLADVQDFAVTDGQLREVLTGKMPPMMAFWANVMHAEADELPLVKDATKMADAFSEETRGRAFSFLLDALKQLQTSNINEEEGSLEEDDSLLAGVSKRSGTHKRLYENVRSDLTARQRLAVVHRRSARLLLLRHMAAFDNHFKDDYEEAIRERAAQDTSPYTSESERSVAEKEEGEKAKKRAERAERIARRQRMEEAPPVGKTEL